MSVENRPRYTDDEREKLKQKKLEEDRLRLENVRKTVHQQQEQFKKSLEPKKLKDFLQVPVSYLSLLDTIVEHYVKGYDVVTVVPFPQQVYLVLKKRSKKEEESPK